MGLDLHTAEDIAKYCNIPLSVAKKRSRRMKQLYEKNMFFTDPLEKKVYTNFEPYIRKVNKKNKNKG